MTRTIVNTRLINATRDVVFEAWTNAEHIKHWWGPMGFTNTISKMDVRPGGEWDFVMHGPDGVDYHNKSVFVEIKYPERIVFDHLKPMHKFQVTATFESIENKTQLTFQMLFESTEEYEKVKTFAIDANEQNFDRLESYIQSNLN